MSRKFACEGSDQQHMSCFFHDESGDGDRMDDPFDRSDCTGPEIRPLHDGGIHAPDAVQLAIRASPCVEEAGLFEKADRALNCQKGRSTPLKDRVTVRERLCEAGRLARRHRTTARAAVNENKGTRRVQLRRRSRACR